MKRNIKKFLLPALAACAVTFAACSDWTDTESLDIHQPSLEEQNPELYKRYLRALREYKAGDHKVVLVTMQNGTGAPVHQSQHLTTVPDSVDFICLTQPGELHPAYAAEVEQVRSEKGTRVVYNIDFDAIEARWKQILEEEAANKPEEPENPDTPERVAEEGSGEGEGEGEGGESEPEETELTRFVQFCGEQTAIQLAYCDTYGYDGIVFSYTGRAMPSMTEEVKADYVARQAAFLDRIGAWRQAHPDKLFFFQGKPQNLADKTLLADCDYVIIPALDATSGDKLSYTMRMAMEEGVPTDRFIIGVTIPSMIDPANLNGYFSGYEQDGKTQLRATKGAAQWVVAPAPYTKAGLAVADAQYDYYNITLVYKNIREAISIMNPAPKN